MKYKNRLFCGASILAMLIIITIQMINDVDWWLIVFPPLLGIPLAYWIYKVSIKKGWIELKRCHWGVKKMVKCKICGGIIEDELYFKGRICEECLACIGEE